MLVRKIITSIVNPTAQFSGSTLALYFGGSWVQISVSRRSILTLFSWFSSVFAGKYQYSIPVGP
jgi:hypothetical protein